MGRWEPDARGRMIRAALELFAEHGFEQTAAGEIAERAGVTERTFFRHFSDKREVLFDGSDALLRTVYDVILDAPAEQDSLTTALAGIIAAAEIIPDRQYAVRRAEVIAANTALRERELLKLAAMREMVDTALRAREVAEPTARLAAHSAVTAFEVGFEQWVGETALGDLAEHITDTAAQLRRLADTERTQAVPDPIHAAPSSAD